LRNISARAESLERQQIADHGLAPGQDPVVRPFKEQTPDLQPIRRRGDSGTF